MVLMVITNAQSCEVERNGPSFYSEHASREGASAQHADRGLCLLLYIKGRYVPCQVNPKRDILMIHLAGLKIHPVV